MVCNPPAAQNYLADVYCVDEDIGYLLRRLSTSILRQADRRLGQHGLTSAQWLPLFKIQIGRCTTISQLARELETDAGGMTRLLDRLETKGLCKRIRSADDRRAINIELTAKGQAAISGVPAALAEAIDAHLNGVSNEERLVLRSYLKRIFDNGTVLRHSN
jgi:DNA-binding MarR family transcriptional regulator